MRKLGCLLPLMLLVALGGEGWLCYRIGAALDEYLLPILVAAVVSFVGWKLLFWRMKTLPLAVMSGRPGPAFIGAIGAALILFPGFATGVVGLLLQLSLVQRLFSPLTGRLMGLAMKAAAGRMAAGMGGGAPGRFGAFPFGAGGGLRPDESVRDTTAERLPPRP